MPSAAEGAIHVAALGVNLKCRDGLGEEDGTMLL
jgi:hypothetical protein